MLLAVRLKAKYITAKLTYYLDLKNHILQEASELWSRMETGFWQTRW